MDMGFFNADHGFVEALVRGFSSTFLTRDELEAMRECPTLAAMNSVLQETDFRDVLPRKFATDDGRPRGAAAGAAAGGAGSSGPAFDHTKLKRNMLEKAAEEFQMLRAHSVEPLSTFLDFITHEYMIDTVVSIMSFVNRSEGLATAAVLEEVQKATEQAHPLGRLDPATERALAGFSASSSDLVELVRALLVDTPVGCYFEDFLLKVLSPEDFGRADGISAALAEQPIYLLEHATKRIWLERFHGWCEAQGGETAHFMCAYLEWEAARRSISMADTAIAEGVVKEEQRPEVLEACFPAIGPLHPTGLKELTAVGSQADIERVVMGVPSLAALWRTCPTIDGHGPDRMERRIAASFPRHDVAELCRLFGSQFHFGPFFAFVRLKNMEAESARQVAEAVAGAERAAASGGRGARRRATPAAEVARAMDRLLIPFHTRSPVEVAAEAGPGGAVAGGYDAMT